MSEKIEVLLGIAKGHTFTDFEDFQQNLKNIAKSKFVQFYILNSRTVRAARHKVKRYLDPNLKYYSVHFACIHGGREFKPRGQGMKKTTTLRKESLCPAHIHVRISDSGKDFVVSSVDNTHNHIVAKNLFKQLPHNRKLPHDVKEDTKKLLQMRANKHMIRDNLEKKLDQNITLKDLRNLQHRGNEGNNNIQNVCKKIQDKFGADCHLLVDENDVFRGLAFCNEVMKTSLSAYPELICIDATYKLLDINAPLYLILNEDGNGESCIIAVGILLQEDKDSLQWFLETFKSCNPSWENIQNIMSDKDITEREVLRSSFPGAQLHICIFHVLKIFQREITTDKLKISSTSRTCLLELLQKMVYASNEEEFDELLKKIKEKFPERVFTYLNENWVNIKTEWCPFLGNKIQNFMNKTNNRLEGINAKFKAVLKKHSTLETFVDSLVVALNSLEKEKNARVANSINKRKLFNFKSEDFRHKYFKFLTPYAFEKLETQFTFNHEEEKVGVLETTLNYCTCYFFNSMGLPCKHIFFVRSKLNIDLFEPSLIIPRWTLSYFYKHCLFLNEINGKTTTDPPNVVNQEQNINIDVLVKETRKGPMTSQEKYKKVFVKSKLIATLAADLCGDNFLKICNTLDTVIDCLQNGNVNFHVTADTTISSSDNADVTNIGSVLDFHNYHSAKDETEIKLSQGTELNEINNELVVEVISENTEQGNDENIHVLNADGITDIGNIPIFHSEINLNEDTDLHEISNELVVEVISDENIEQINDDENIHILNTNGISHIGNVNSTIYDKNNKAINENITDVHNTNTDSAENIENSKEMNLQTVKVPKIKRRGRPAGSDITVIGLPKRKTKEPGPKPFDKRPTKERIDTILKWILKDTNIIQYKQIQINDLKDVNQIDIRLLEVNMCILRKYFHQEDWNIFKNYKKMVQETAIWKCKMCNNNIEKEPTIRCDYCLSWFHIVCCDLSNKIEHMKSTFMCSKCL